MMDPIDDRNALVKALKLGAAAWLENKARTAKPRRRKAEIIPVADLLTNDSSKLPEKRECGPVAGFSGAPAGKQAPERGRGL